MRDNETTSRRIVLRATGVAVAAALAGCSGGGGGDGSGGYGGGGSTSTETATATPTASPTGTSGGSSEFDGWFSDVDNYDGVVDETGSDAVTVQVGVDNDGQPYGFGPAAVRVSTGTTVTWEWTGEGGAHNVKAEDDSFESELIDEEGFTFEETFEEAGTTKYACVPHKALGMKGVVVVE
jgi:halocyanin-like protein